MRFNKLIPELGVSDFQRSLQFYKEVGFKVEYSRENFAFLSFNGSQVMIELANDTWKTGELEYPFGRGINFQIGVEDAGKLAEELKERGIRLFRELQDNWYRMDDRLLGCREFLVQDPDGYLLRFSEDLESTAQSSQ